jgi:hypothetical protein
MFYKTVHTNYRSLIQLLPILSRLHTTHRNHRLPLLYRNQKHHPKILDSSSNTTQRNNAPVLLFSAKLRSQIKRNQERNNKQRRKSFGNRRSNKNRNRLHSNHRFHLRHPSNQSCHHLCSRPIGRNCLYPKPTIARVHPAFKSKFVRIIYAVIFYRLLSHTLCTVAPPNGVCSISLPKAPDAAST